MRLDAKDVNISISGKPIVQHLSIEVPDRKFSALLGANGSGKTTLLPLHLPHTKDGQRHRSSG